MSGKVLCIVLLALTATLNYNPVLFAQDDKPVGEITGVVREAKSHSPLLGVNVIIVGLLKGAATDENGAFVIRNVPPGIYTVKASMVGYVTQVKTDVVVAPSRQTRLVFEMAEAVLEMGEVTVTADYFSRRQELSTSAHTLNYEEIRRSPGAAEDISR
ncbi:MAG: carboxypeptidase-like regulatory domain-containing protein, partial [Chlorobi bacterium]|nr:carboxypeptidase-like regulatory domain-containing protein [Chlorobiota bacterium]